MQMYKGCCDPADEEAVDAWDVVRLQECLNTRSVQPTPDDDLPVWKKLKEETPTCKYLLVYTPKGVVCIKLPVCCNVVTLEDGDLTSESKKIHSPVDLNDFFANSTMQCTLSLDRMWHPYVHWNV